MINVLSFNFDYALSEFQGQSALVSILKSILDFFFFFLNQAKLEDGDF